MLARVKKCINTTRSCRLLRFGNRDDCSGCRGPRLRRRCRKPGGCRVCSRRGGDSSRRGIWCDRIRISSPGMLWVRLIRGHWLRVNTVSGWLAAKIRRVDCTVAGRVPAAKALCLPGMQSLFHIPCIRWSRWCGRRENRSQTCELRGNTWKK